MAGRKHIAKLAALSFPSSDASYLDKLAQKLATIAVARKKQGRKKEKVNLNF